MDLNGFLDSFLSRKGNTLLFPVAKKMGRLGAHQLNQGPLEGPILLIMYIYRLLTAFIALSSNRRSADECLNARKPIASPLVRCRLGYRAWGAAMAFGAPAGCFLGSD